ncbi:Hypothetical predicted protein [Paramuricea clavata]|uniref:Uncharacterized protein n=1 Tax=Paramuricea clavata TaxID=317549 RepID=A0A7D9ILL3_PARCT|nr:Hypothetical predicted protein [Paramuricea clavata]
MIFRPNLDFAVNFHTFPIYVSETDFFPVDLEYTKPEYVGTGNFVNLIPFDYHQNSYFRSLAACYIATFKSGISENHLNNTLSDSHLITSIVKFHVHYQMEKFMKDQKLIDHYLNEDDLYVLGKYMPTTETWERRTLSSHANLGTWYYGLPADTRQRIRNRHYVRTRYGGTFIEYEYLTKRLPKNVTEDYKIFIPKTSRGLTKIGRRLFQQSLEVYVYAVLGAQAKTRWSITGQGAKSLQTQDVFRKVLKDSIVQNDITTIIRNMRTAIADTNVVLNFAIMPGLILILSDMRILQKTLKGYSNILTLAKSGMSFGKNDEVNFTEQSPMKTSTSPIKSPVKTSTSPSTSPVKTSTSPVKTSTSPVKTSTSPTRDTNLQNPSTLKILAVASMGVAYFLFK